MNSIKMNPLRASMAAPKMAMGQKMPGLQTVRGLGGAHFANPEFIQQGHNTSKHPGFKAVQSKIASKEGVSKDRAGAILAASTRRASSAAKKVNPRLKRVK